VGPGHGHIFRTRRLVDNHIPVSIADEQIAPAICIKIPRLSGRGVKGIAQCRVSARLSGRVVETKSWDEPAVGMLKDRPLAAGRSEDFPAAVSIEIRKPRAIEQRLLVRTGRIGKDEVIREGSFGSLFEEQRPGPDL